MTKDKGQPATPNRIVPLGDASVIDIENSQTDVKIDLEWLPYDAQDLEAIAEKACEDMLLLDDALLEAILSEGANLNKVEDSFVPVVQLRQDARPRPDDDDDMQEPTPGLPPAEPPASCRPCFEKVLIPNVATDDAEDVRSPGGRFANSIISPGDILNIRGDINAISRLGATGGFMGHVALAVSEEMVVPLDSDAGKLFYKYTDGGRNPLLAVNIVECSRQTPGLSESQLILYTKNDTAFLLGEHDGQDLTRFEDIEEVHIWNGPAAFCGQENFCLFVMEEVLAEMRANQRNWSWTTAVRSFLLSGQMSPRDDVPVTMQEIRESWKAEPICSSIVVSFWQQYLYRMAQLQQADPLQMILKNMPLKADRVLPGELLQCLLAHGWTLGGSLSETSDNLHAHHSWSVGDTRASETNDKFFLSRSHSL
jgi:hypothetical protein